MEKYTPHTSHEHPTIMVSFIRDQMFILTPFSLLLLLVHIFITIIIFRHFYNVFLHPLARFPGPKLFASSVLPICWLRLTGRSVKAITALHARYGQVVRIGPSELSYTDPKAWKHIYGSKYETSIGEQMPKQGEFYDEIGASSGGSHSLFSEPDDAEHSRKRKIFGRAFSNKASAEQEGISNYFTKVP